MTQRKMSSSELQRAYQLAVKSSLTAFYGKTRSEADQMVNEWWQRLAQDSDDVSSGMYLHTEPLAAAADLSREQEIELTDDLRTRYKVILARSERQAMLPGQELRRVRNASASTGKRPAKKAAAKLLKHVAG